MCIRDSLDTIGLVRTLRKHSAHIGTGWTAEPPAPDVVDIVGTWFWGPRPHVLTAEGSQLRLAPVGGGRGSRFASDAAGGWIGLDEYFAGERLTVHPGQGGGAAYLDLGTFRFTRTPYDPSGDIPGGTGTGWR